MTSGRATTCPPRQEVGSDLNAHTHWCTILNVHCHNVVIHTSATFNFHDMRFGANTSTLLFCMRRAVRPTGNGLALMANQSFVFRELTGRVIIVIVTVFVCERSGLMIDFIRYDCLIDSRLRSIHVCIHVASVHMRFEHVCVWDCSGRHLFESHALDAELVN